MLKGIIFKLEYFFYFMCFTPAISLTTAIIEFILATVLLLFFPKIKFRNFFAVFIYLLGFYQFSEFMICSGFSPYLWATLGFITYSFLPAVGLHSILYFSKKKFNILFIYLIPIIVSLVALVTPKFIQTVSCDRFFILVRSLFHSGASWWLVILFFLYVVYYVGFIILMCFVGYQYAIKQKNKLKRKLVFVIILGVLLMTLPTFILIFLFPSLSIMFPSVLCEFALLLAICAFIGAYLESKIERR